MPIKDLKIYPPYWKQFSLYIRKERAGDKCEQCNVPNGAAVGRGFFAGNAFWYDGATGELFSAVNGDPMGKIRAYDLDILRYTTIVLTVAHLDSKGGVCDCKERTGLKCARPDHVLALCQACHLKMDLPHHIANRRESLRRKKDAGRHLFSEIV